MNIDERLNAMRNKVAHNIDKHGWHFTAVFPDEASWVPAYWGYTTGLLKTYGHPELVVFGVQPKIAHAIVREIIDHHIAQGREFTDGERVGGMLQDGYDLFFREAPCDDPDYPLNVSRDYYGVETIPALQVVLPDDANRFPWEDGCDPRMLRMQQVLVRD